MYECCVTTTLSNFECVEKGEIVMIIEGEDEPSPLNELSTEEHVKRYMDEGLSKKEAIKRTAKDLGLPKNEVYAQALGIASEDE